MTKIIGQSILKEIYPPRPAGAKKYDYGHLLVIGGSNLYSGSPALNALAAVKTGVDLVTVAAPERAANIIASFSPDLITYPLEGDYLTPKHLKELLTLSKNKTAFIIGGGMCRTPLTFQLIQSYLKETPISCGVIDADGLHAIAQEKHLLKRKKLILTPHLFEFYVLQGEDIAKDSWENKIKKVSDFAREYETTLVLKGEVDIIADRVEVAGNKTGSPYLTKGGTGDTLAGIAGSLLAQKIAPFPAACGAAYINGRAGELAARKLKQSLMAENLVEFIPQIWR